LGVGRFAEFGVHYTDEVAACSQCDGAEAEFLRQQAPKAHFKMGTAEGQFFKYQPAVALGFERTVRDLEASSDASDVFSRATLANLYLAAAKGIGPVRVHGGVQLWDARVHRAGDVARFRDRSLAERVRPFAGLTWTPGIYPKTTLLADAMFTPLIGADKTELRWLLGWGVRYRYIQRSSAELLVRHREGDSLSGATVMVRLNVALRR
jgi:hypothetical protein